MLIRIIVEIQQEGRIVKSVEVDDSLADTRNGGAASTALVESRDIGTLKDEVATGGEAPEALSEVDRGETSMEVFSSQGGAAPTID